MKPGALLQLAGKLLVAFLALVIWVGAVRAEKRVALVIGNSAYRNVATLKNPANDAEDISRALSSLGFEVVSGRDLDREAMRGKVQEFSGKLEGADVALFYYAGHAVQVDGQNYLAPIDTDLKKEADLDFETVSLDLVRRQMERDATTQLIFLDACRNNPLGRSLGRSARSQAEGNGLARLETSAEGTFIAFATQPDNIALDGDGRNSPFTEAVLKHINRAGVELSELMTDVRREVYEVTAKQQLPWTNSSLLGAFYFKAAVPPPQLTAEEKARAEKLLALAGEAEAWERIAGSKDVSVFETFLKTHGSGSYGDLARFTLEKLRPPEAAKAVSLAPAAAVLATKPIETAALPTLAEAEPKPENVAPIAIEPDKQVIRSTQNELTRLGCNAGGADGIWGANSRQALGKYAIHAQVDLVSLEPNADLLASLKSTSARICPLAVPVLKPAAKPNAKTVVRPATKLATIKKPPTHRKVASARKKAQGTNCFRFNGKLICD